MCVDRGVSPRRPGLEGKSRYCAPTPRGLPTVRPRVSVDLASRDGTPERPLTDLQRNHLGAYVHHPMWAQELGIVVLEYARTSGDLWLVEF